jgi:hypothetical protein
MLKSKQSAGAEQLRIVSQYPYFKEDLANLKQILLPIELQILQLMIKAGHPLLTRNIYTALLSKTFAESSKNLNRKLPEYKLLIVPKAPSFTTKTRLMESVLRQSSIPLPSYSKISNVLKRLHSWGFLSTRKDDGIYWVLNPRFSREFKHMFKGILNL